MSRRTNPICAISGTTNDRRFQYVRCLPTRHTLNLSRIDIFWRGCLAGRAERKVKWRQRATDRPMTLEGNLEFEEFWMERLGSTRSLTHVSHRRGNRKEVRVAGGSRVSSNIGRWVLLGIVVSSSPSWR